MLGDGRRLVMPGGTWQVIHSDLEWDSAGDEVPLVVVVNYYVSEVSPTNGAMRLLPGTAHFPPPSHWVKRSEPSWMQQALVTGRPGFAVIRDPRAWHGGTPNTSASPGTCRASGVCPAQCATRQPHHEDGDGPATPEGLDRRVLELLTMQVRSVQSVRSGTGPRRHATQAETESAQGAYAAPVSVLITKRRSLHG